MFELLKAASNFAEMLVVMDNVLFRGVSTNKTTNLYKSIRMGGFWLETMPKWEDTPLGQLESEYVL